jgi:predicted dehydrogenase
MDRRDFIKTSGAAGIGLTVANQFPSVQVRDASQRPVRVAIMGVNGRGAGLAEAFARGEGTEVSVICDVDERAVRRTVDAISSPRAVRDGDSRTDELPALQDRVPEGLSDFRQALGRTDVDALVIAAPDHWHAPATLLALKAGKHVYVEKPCGHNPKEGELLVEAQKKYDLVVQMGNQQRSSPRTRQVIEEIRDGLIGRAYFARAWYANTRGPIGRGAKARVPDWLDYELWQGPAPRTPFRDNVVHYNWHWFWRWGTGEICNNGTHELDVCRWALGVDYPTRVTSAGGRYHFEDDWEAYDTQVASFDFEGGKTITWEGRSCNGRTIDGRGRGASIHGEKGTVVIDRDGYVVYDQENREIRRDISQGNEQALDVRGGGTLTDLHIRNFAEAVRGEAGQNAPILGGHKSVLLCHLGNIAQRASAQLTCDPETGRVRDDELMDRFWSRDYQPGWEPTI